MDLSPEIIKSVAEQVKEVVELGVEVAVVVGGGNIWRGKVGSEMGMDRATADYMGMLATVMNSFALQDSLEKLGIETRVQTSIEMRQVAEPYIRRKAIRHLRKETCCYFCSRNRKSILLNRYNSSTYEQQKLKQMLF